LRPNFGISSMGPSFMKASQRPADGDTRPVDGRQRVARTPAESGAEVDAVRDAAAPREPGSMRREPNLLTSSTHEPRRAERRRMPPCPQCDATDVERVPAVAPESRLRWFQCRGCGHLWNVGPPNRPLSEESRRDVPAARAGRRGLGRGAEGDG
jgi:hypothetical protein